MIFWGVHEIENNQHPKKSPRFFSFAIPSFTNEAVENKKFHYENNRFLERRRKGYKNEAYFYDGLVTLTQLLTVTVVIFGAISMEVDLLSIEDRIEIELDGPQHLGNVDAYRRDRRKDVLLQENGYTILRFLTDDVNKHLDVVLDTILRAISHRNTSSQQIIKKRRTRSLPIAANVQ